MEASMPPSPCFQVVEADHPVPHVAILPSPGIGLLTPMVELGRLLVSIHGLRATVFVITTGASAAQSHVLRRSAAHLPDGLRFVDLPSSGEVNLPIDASIENRISVLVRDSMPSLRSALLALPQAPGILVADIFGTDAFDVADELGLCKYLFFASPAETLALCMYLPTLDRDVDGEYTDLQAPVRIPGCKPIPPHELLGTVRLKRADEGRKMFVRHCRNFTRSLGILVNTCAEIEPELLSAMAEEQAFKEIMVPPVYAVGPVIYHPDPDSAFPSPSPAWLQWLDKQPEGSVLFVSFGSGGTLSSKQTAELAWGLERSGQRFLWVIRWPEDHGEPSAAFFTSGRDLDVPVSYLPEGFMNRTEGRGFLLPSWAPQVAILRHPAVGGFLTHGGWNSALESLSYGVAMLVWPLFAEQRMNAAKLEEELGVAVRVRAGEEADGLVMREEVERVVRLLMDPGSNEGVAMRAKAAELRVVFASALGVGGSSCNSLAAVVAEWTKVSKSSLHHHHGSGLERSGGHNSEGGGAE